MWVCGTRRGREKTVGYTSHPKVSQHMSAARTGVILLMWSPHTHINEKTCFNFLRLANSFNRSQYKLHPFFCQSSNTPGRERLYSPQSIQLKLKSKKTLSKPPGRAAHSNWNPSSFIRSPIALRSKAHNQRRVHKLRLSVLHPILRFRVAVVTGCIYKKLLRQEQAARHSLYTEQRRACSRRTYSHYK